MDPLPQLRHLLPRAIQLSGGGFLRPLLQPSVERGLTAERPLAARLLKSPEPLGGYRRPIRGRALWQEEQEHMVTNYPHSFASRDDQPDVTAESGSIEAPGVRMMDRV